MKTDLQKIIGGSLFLLLLLGCRPAHSGLARELDGFWRTENEPDGQVAVEVLCLDPSGKFASLTATTYHIAAKTVYDPHNIFGVSGTWSLKGTSLNAQTRPHGDSFGGMIIGTVTDVKADEFTVTTPGGSRRFHRLSADEGAVAMRFAKMMDAWKYSEKGAQYWAKDPEVGKIVELMRPQGREIPFSRNSPSIAGLKLLRVGMTRQEVDAVMPQVHRWTSHPWGSVWYYPTGMSNGLDSRTEADLTPVVLDKEGKVIGWGNEFLETKLKLAEDARNTEAARLKLPEIERNKAGLLLLKEGMKKPEVNALMRNIQNQRTYPWGTVWQIRTGPNDDLSMKVLHAREITPNPAFTPLVFDADGKLIGWSWEILQEQLKKAGAH